MAAARHQSITRVGKLYLAFELGWSEWKLAFASAAGEAPRIRTIAGRDLTALAKEIVSAKAKFRLPADVPVVCCYEAGRDGHWLFRYLTAKGFTCHEVDSASIKVDRRQRRAKTDVLDACELLSQLIRFDSGEKKVWRVVRVPSAEDEARRHLHREREDWQTQRTQHSNRIKGLLASQGLEANVGPKFLAQLDALRDWEGKPLNEELKSRLRRQFEGWQLANRMLKDLVNRQVREIRRSVDPSLDPIRRLVQWKGIGIQGAWLLTREIFGWRRIANVRQVGSIAGLTPTPYRSGDSRREQGISKAGNRRVRAMAIELAWSWLRFQPGSELSKWFRDRFGQGSRLRKIGIVAVARKLLVALWKYLEFGEVPKGAEAVPWEEKLRCRPQAA